MNQSRGLEHTAMSDVGMRRANNQDNFAVVFARDDQTWRASGHVFIVADGMGAHAAGELASKVACDTIPHLYRKYCETSAPEAIERSIREANGEIHRRGQANADFHNMGTTCSMLALLPQGALVGHVGDSRVYRVRRGLLEQLTFDHSLVWEMQAAGHLSENAEIARKVPKNVITRSLGPNANVQVDVEGPHAVELGDTFLLCSDGLTGPVTDEELAPILAHLPTDDAVRLLIDLANLRGGPDNITVIAVRVKDPEVCTAPHGEPLRVGGKKPEGKVHPALWVVLGVCALLTLLMLITGQLIPAAISLLGALVAGAIVLWRRYGGAVEGAALGEGRRLGKGPYTRTSCDVAPPLLDKLAGIVAELREAARHEDWNIDWARLDRHQTAAERARRDGALPEALRAYGHAVSFMVEELHRQQAGKGGDSNVL